MSFAARPYQLDMIERLRQAIAAGQRKPLAVLPCGGGKTIIASLIIDAAAARGSQILFLCHRRELVNQTSKKLDAIRVAHGVIMADHARHAPYLPVQVASVATFVRRLGLKGHARDIRIKPDLIFVDEAHHARARSYQTILEAFPEAACLGLTATPVRLDGRGLGALFDVIVPGPSVRELIDLGNLVAAKGFTYEIPDLREVRKQAGDYNMAQLDVAMSKVLLGGDYVREWQAHAAGKRTVVFAVNVRHSKLIVEQFRAAGVPAEHVDDSTPSDERDGILGRLASGETLVVSNVGILTEGWDLPACEVCILARPTKSVALFLQMAGRVLRPWCFTCADAPGDGCGEHVVKAHARIHDHAGVILEHGLVEQDRAWSLDGDRKPGAAPVRRCPACFCVCAAGCVVCPECGASLRSAGDAPERTVESVAGKKIDLDSMRGELEAIAAKRKRLELPELTPGQLLRVAQATPEQRGAEFLRLQKIAAEKGFKPGWVGYAYREVFAVWPNFKEEFLAKCVAAEAQFVRLPWKKLPEKSEVSVHVRIRNALRRQLEKGPADRDALLRAVVCSEFPRDLVVGALSEIAEQQVGAFGNYVLVLKQGAA